MPNLKKKITFVLIASTFFFSGNFLAPQKAEAVFVPVGDVVNFEFHAFGQLKEQGLDVLAWAIAKEAINALTGDIIDWINSGFNGNPAFVQNPLDFLRNVEDQTAVDFIRGREDLLDDTPFGDQVIQALIYDYSNTSFEQPYNLDNYSSDPEAFLSGDFSAGGWDAWFATTENPTNTFLGSYIEGKQDEETAINRRREEEILKLEWGEGFQSVEDELGNILTPGTIIKSQLEDVLGSGLRSLENADELSEVITALVGSLVQDIFSSTGLLGTSVASPDGEALTELFRQATRDVIIGDQDTGTIPVPRETATPGNDPTPSSNSRLSITCRVTKTRIEVGQRTSFNISISRGRAPYDIQWEGDIDNIIGFDREDRKQTVQIDQAGTYSIGVTVRDANGGEDFDQCPLIGVEDII